MYVSNVCMHICFMCVYLYMLVCVYVYMYVYMYVCIHKYMNTHAQGSSICSCNEGYYGTVSATATLSSTLENTGCTACPAGKYNSLRNQTHSCGMSGYVYLICIYIYIYSICIYVYMCVLVQRMMQSIEETNHSCGMPGYVYLL